MISSSATSLKAGTQPVDARLMSKPRKRQYLFTALITILIAAIWLGCSFGAAGYQLTLPIQVAIKALLGEPLSAIENIVLNIRAPRVFMAVLVGSALAVSGASLQGICRNPLADPGLIGVSAGAAVGAVVTILLGQSIPFILQLGAYAISVAAVLGAAVTAFTVYYLARVDGRLEVPTLLLAGVAINALGVAIIGIFNYLADDQALRLITFWLMGSLAGASWQAVAIIAPCLGLSIYLSYRQRYALNLLLLGEANARFSGIDVDRVKLQLLWLNALAVGVAVAFSGIIAFVGLVVPHILRMCSNTNYRYLLVNAAILGGALLVLADLLARSMVAPAEIPIGVLTSLIGAPFFIALLIHQKRRIGGQW